MPVKNARLYVGVIKNEQHWDSIWSTKIFRSDITPTKSNYPQFSYVIGPFKTKAGAQIMAQATQRGIPHIVTVAQAERLAKSGYKL